ncbi:MAG: DNA topoisomerase IB [Lapillicoccus sp.]
MRLRRSNLSGAGLRRVRRGKGWSYRDDDGHQVDEADKERIQALVIPPAWKNVWISPYPNGHIQAVGTDDAGRRQYLYHGSWTETRGRAKHERVQQLVPRLPEFRKAVNRDLRRSGLTRDRVIAVALRMLDLGLFRTGGEEYEQEHGTHGVTKLHRDHVTVRRDDIHFLFPAKSGVEREAQVTDPPLAVAIRVLKRSNAPGERLLQYRDSTGWHEITGAEVNESFKALTGADFTVKDLRTWAATVTAAAALAEKALRDEDQTPSKTAMAKTEREVVKLVSEQIGNTPAVARRSYVDPVVLDKHSSGTTLANAGRLFTRLSKVDHVRILSGDPLSPRGRETVERAVLRMLAQA